MKFKIEQGLLDLVDQDKLRQSIIALRSGKYNQHKESMTNPGDPKSACCLMVIAQEVDKMPYGNAIKAGPFSGQIYATTLPVMELAPFATTLYNSMRAESPDYNKILKLSELNDRIMTHPQIADLLDGHEVWISEEKASTIYRK